jgi:ADP-ribose pyrophosphatase YjhB (NUDIX family)
MKKVVRTFLKNDEWKYLLVKHHKNWHWVLPWWHLENWENIYKALKREIKEELNLKIKILWNKVWFELEFIKEKPLPLCIYKIEYIDRKEEERKKLEYIFLSEIDSWNLEIQKNEIFQCKFFTKEEILKEDKIYPQMKEIAKLF